MSDTLLKCEKWMFEHANILSDLAVGIVKKIQKCNMDYEQLSEYVDYSFSAKTLSEIAEGEYDISLEELFLLCDKLDFDLQINLEV